MGLKTDEKLKLNTLKENNMETEMIATIEQIISILKDNDDELENIVFCAQKKDGSVIYSRMGNYIALAGMCEYFKANVYDEVKQKILEERAI